MRPRPRWRASSAPSPAMTRNARRDAARHPQSSPRRPWRGRRLRGACRSRPSPLDHATLALRRCQALGAARAAPPGTRRSRSARSTASATRRSRVIAPTGTIGLVMDCDTTGIEPDFALVKFKKLAGGGYFKIINRAVPEALRALGYRRSADRRDRRLCGRPRHARPGARRQLTSAARARASPTRRSQASKRRSPAPSTSASSSTNGRSARTSAPTR